MKIINKGMKKEITIILISLFFTTIISNAQSGQWTWMNGDSSFYSAGGGVNQYGLFDSTNHPGNWYDACEWTDLSGNFWIFGGRASVNILLSGLEEFKPSINEWAVIKVKVGQNRGGIYGIQNINDTANSPGCRGDGVATWVDTSGNLWLFGGYGFDKDSIKGALSDLWKYTIATNTWTWIAGPDTANSPGNYGTIMVPSSANNPPARFYTNCSWTDNNNNLWLFGGFEQYVGQGRLSDLWKYDIATHQWTWMKGPNTLDQPAVYGTMGVPNINNIPSARFCYNKWKDSHGNFWLFGGSGPGSAFNVLNDMWKYNPITNEWTWMSGTNVLNNTGTGTTHCNPSVNYNPGARYDNRACWTLGCDNFVLFGGSIDSTASNDGNDLWCYSVNTNKWTLMSGTLNPNDTGNYGVKLVSSSSNLPPSREEANGWTDNNGNLWMFGGLDIHSNKRFSDMWRFVPDTTCPHKCINSGTEEISLNKNEVIIYPNPFNNTTTLIIKGNTSKTDYTLSIYNLLGQEVRSIYTGSNKEIIINREDLSSGMYFYRLIDNTGQSVSGKLFIE